MKIHKVLLCLAAIIITALPLYSEVNHGDAAGAGKRMAVFLNTGAGIAYNVYLEDAQNELVDNFEYTTAFREVDDKSGGAWGYTSIGLEPRYTSGNIVYGVPLAYFNLSDSRRVLVNGASVIESEAILSIWSVSCTAFYKINRPDSNYLLLGGGAGIYFGTIKWELVGVSDSDTKWTIGWQTGIEYHWVWGNVDIYTGLTSRFAEIINFKVHSDEKSNMIAGLTGLHFNIGAGYSF